MRPRVPVIITGLFSEIMCGLKRLYLEYCYVKMFSELSFRRGLAKSTSPAMALIRIRILEWGFMAFCYAWIASLPEGSFSHVTLRRVDEDEVFIRYFSTVVKVNLLNAYISISVEMP